MFWQWFFDKILLPGRPNVKVLEKSLFNAMSIVKYCYGKDSEQFQILLDTKKTFGKIPYSNYSYNVCMNLIGILEGLKFDLEQGLLTSIEKQTTGAIYADMLTISKQLIDEGHVEPASVLACGAFEDCMKKFAKSHDLDVDDADLNQVINALKSNSLLKGPQASVAKSFVQLRNKSFHANWEKIDVPEIKSLISFTEEFILKNFN